ncbi:MAG: hypothetical protein WBA41_32215 [Rivularia sp. (in: cyanobacteria)]
MSLTEEELFSLRDAIHQAFVKPDDLTDFFNENEDLNGNLILKINYKDEKILHDDCLNKLNIYNQNEQKYKLLTLEGLNTKGINFEEEVDNIISKTNKNKLIEYEIGEHTIAKNSSQVREAISNNYQICHVFGHGNNGFILTEKERIKPEQLEAWLKFQNNYQCFIFNICCSEIIAKQISKYVDYVIGMSQAINDDVAIKFAKGFYLGLKNGIDNNQDMFLRGFREGIQAISGDKNSQYNIPVLYISYKRAILNLIKQLDAENKIEDFLSKLHSKLLQHHRFIKIYNKYTYSIKQPYLNRLAEIIVNEINNNNWNLVQSAYRETLPENATVDNSKLNNPQNINNIIDILREKYPFVRGNVPSILEFSKNLASKFAENSQEYPRIKSWVAEISSKLNISIDVQPKIESSLTTNPKTCLLIIISPEEANFRLKAEYILDENQKSPPLPFDFQKQANTDYETENGVICSEKEIPSVLEKIINSFMSRFKKNINILKPIIEIFLPYKYIGKNLDHEWRIQDDNQDKIAIVQEYNIIFYPLERCTGNNSYFSFKESWLKFKTLLESDADPKSIVAGFEIIQTVNKNYRILGKCLKEKIGVKLMSPFPVKEQEQEYFWRAVLSGGTPLAFWTRYHPQKQMNLDDIDTYLAKEYLENDFTKLIEEIWNLRQNAYNDEENQEDELGYHLGFLCDNLNRIQRSRLLQSFL